MENSPPAGEIRLPHRERVVPRRSWRRYRQSTARPQRSARRAARADTRALDENGTTFLQRQGDGSKLERELFSLADQDAPTVAPARARGSSGVAGSCTFRAFRTMFLRGR